MESDKKKPSSNQPMNIDPTVSETAAVPARSTTKEYNGPKGPEPTRYGDWEQKGRCTDF